MIFISEKRNEATKELISAFGKNPQKFKMKAYLLFFLLTLVGASEDINANEIKRRMKLIGGIPNYGLQNVASKIQGRPIEDDVEYTDPNLVLQYNATSHFNAKGMGHLYSVTRTFMSLIQPNSSYPDGKFEFCFIQ